MTDENEERTTRTHAKRSKMKNQRRLFMKLMKGGQRKKSLKSLLYHPNNKTEQNESLPAMVQKQDGNPAVYLLLMLCCSVFAILLNLMESRSNPTNHQLMDYRSLSLEEREEGELVELLFPSTLMNSSSSSPVPFVNASATNTEEDETSTKYLRAGQSREPIANNQKILKEMDDATKPLKSNLDGKEHATSIERAKTASKKQ